MATQKLTGIYFQSLKNGSKDVVDLDTIVSFIEKLPEVKIIWRSEHSPLIDSSFYADKTDMLELQQVIIVGKHPGMIKSFFSKVLALTKSHPKLRMLDLTKYEAIKNNETNKALSLVYCTVKNIPLEEIVITETVKANPETLVIGAGIAGIQAALEIANGKQKVYLLERTGTIGGHMAMFDKTFPTLDCAACILTPKMVEVGQHSHIDILTYSELKAVSGVPGNFKVQILKRARRVNLESCIGCGICAEKCPVKVPSEFDAGAGLRKAIYIPFPQAVPNKYLIDNDNCRYTQENGKCGVCAKVCPVPGCINYDDKDEIIELNVGNIIVSTGFQPFDARKIEQFGYGKFPNVLTSLELERLINASGPTEGDIVTRSQDKKGNWIFSKGNPVPGKFALIHCVGSRDENHHKYCSRVCCMYSLKLAHLIKEKLPDAEVYEYYIDMRAFGKGYEEFYNRIKNEGIHIIRGKTATIKQSNDKLALRTEDMENLRIIEQEVDMVVLAIGLEPRSDNQQLAEILNIDVDESGWFSSHTALGDPVGTANEGVKIAGVCQGPKDIPDTVTQASAASSSVLQTILNGHTIGKISYPTPDMIDSKINKK